jgi:hypothetical protein
MRRKHTCSMPLKLIQPPDRIVVSTHMERGTYIKCSDQLSALRYSLTYVDSTRDKKCRKVDRGNIKNNVHAALPSLNHPKVPSINNPNMSDKQDGIHATRAQSKSKQSCKLYFKKKSHKITNNKKTQPFLSSHTCALI